MECFVPLYCRFVRMRFARCGAADVRTRIPRGYPKRHTSSRKDRCDPKARTHHGGPRQPRRNLRRPNARCAENGRFRPAAYVRHVRRHRAGARSHRPAGVHHSAVRRSGHAAVPPSFQGQGPGVPGIFLRLHCRLPGHSPQRRTRASALRLPGRAQAFCTWFFPPCSALSGPRASCASSRPWSPAPSSLPSA